MILVLRCVSFSTLHEAKVVMVYRVELVGHGGLMSYSDARLDCVQY